MARTLIIAEKPSVARDIARVVGASGKGEGCLASDQYVVTWALGHLVRLAEPDELDPAYKRWTLASLPILPEKWELKPISKTRAQLAAVKRLIKSPEIGDLICATDAGREGELIFRWIYQTAGCKKPVRRLWISSMTDEAIREGMASLKPAAAYDALFESAVCRARADWLIGMNLSRAFTVRYDALLSIGRVQTPTLALLVARKREIDAFVPKTSYAAEADFGDYKGTYFDPKAPKEAESSAMPTREAAERIARAVRAQQGTITQSARTPFTEAPPQLFDLTTLQREANRRFGLTAKQTLAVAQSLYEKHKLVTYPRTESRLLPFDMKPKAEAVLRSLPEPLSPLAAPALAGVAAAKAGRVFQKDIHSDHHAIVPTGKPIHWDKLAPDERKIMEMIARRLLAAFYPPYEGVKRRVVTEVGEYAFLTQAREDQAMGWKAVEGAEKPRLPALAVGEKRAVKSAEVQERVTKPPEPYTDASILYAMEHAGRTVEDEQLKEAMKKHGLGTPATRAAILERLIDVGYAARKGKALLPTEKGCQLIALAPAALSSAELTGQWEYGLNVIAEQKTVDAAFIERFMAGVTKLTAELVEQVRSDDRPAAFDREQRGPARKRAARRTRTSAASTLEASCPLCGKGNVTESERAFGCSRWKQGCGFTLWKDALQKRGGPALNRRIVEALLKDGQVRGSTGVIALSGGMLRFAFAESTEVIPPIPIAYDKKKKGY